MAKVIEIGQYAVAHYVEIAAALGALLGGVVAVLAIIPGEQPGESKLKSIANKLLKIGKKPEIE